MAKGGCLSSIHLPMVGSHSAFYQVWYILAEYQLCPVPWPTGILLSGGPFPPDISENPQESLHVYLSVSYTLLIWGSVEDGGSLKSSRLGYGEGG